MTQGKYLTTEQRKKIIELRLVEKIPAQVVADRFQISKQTVVDILKRHKGGKGYVHS